MTDEHPPPVGRTGSTQPDDPQIGSHDERADLERLLAEMLDATTDLVWSVDPDMRLLSANAPFRQAVERQTGWQVRPGDDLSSIGFAEAELEVWRSAYGRAMAGERFSVRQEFPDGSYDLRFAPLADRRGVAVVATDVTATLMAERTLAQREQLLSIATRLGRVAAWRLDAATREVTLSPELIEMFDAEPRTTISFDEALEFYPPSERDSIRADIEHCLAEQRPIDRRLKVVRPGGQERWVRLLAAPRLDDHGRVVAVFGAIADVTDRQRRTAKLREQESLLDNASDAIVVRGSDGMVRYWNRAAERTYGWSADEAVGRHIADLVDDGDIDKFEAIEEDLRRQGEWSGRVENTDRHGRRMIVDLHINTIPGDDGHPASVFSIARDVSEQVALEQQLFQAQKLEAIGQLAGGIAHDFNNLLTVISGSAELLGDLVGDDTEAVALVETVLAATTRGSDLTQRLLASARRQPLRPEVIDPVEAVNDSLRLLRRSLPETIEIVTTGHATACAIDVDPAQFETAILNIALNARDAMQGRGTLSITIDTVRSGDHERPDDRCPEPESVRVSIADTGRGMSDEVRTRAFDPFFTTKPVGAGSGLGLSMVHGFVRQSGGTVTIRSEPGVGTTVDMVFPRTGTRPARTLGESEDAPGGNERILVVEDDPLLRSQTVNLLQRLGYHVEAVADGSAAIEYIEQAVPPIRLVFSDVVMPGGIDGVELSREVRRRWPHLPVVLTSGYHDDQHHRTSDDRPFLRKPYRRSAVARTIRQTLDDTR